MISAQSAVILDTPVIDLRQGAVATGGQYRARG